MVLTKYFSGAWSKIEARSEYSAKNGLKLLSRRMDKPRLTMWFVQEEVQYKKK
jgi:hypothetical protein